MKFNILTIPPFDKQLKRLVKKYPSLKNDFSSFLKSLEIEPEQGVALGKNCFKVRLAISAKGKGKSAGARLITNVVVTETIVYLLSIYDKSEKENLTNKELAELLRFVPE